MDEVVRFPGMKPHKQLTYASKQLIAREVIFSDKSHVYTSLFCEQSPMPYSIDMSS